MTDKDIHDNQHDVLCDTQYDTQCNNQHNPQSDTECDNQHNADTDNDRNRDRNRFIPNSRYFTIVCYGLLFVLGTILIYNFIGNFHSTIKGIKYVISILSPFIVGGFIAFILFPLVRLLYRKVFIGLFHMKSEKGAKYLSILVTYIIAIGLVAILLGVVIPQIASSIAEITELLPVWYNNALDFILSLEANHPSLNETFNFEAINKKIEEALPSLINSTTSMLTNIVPVVVTTSVAIVKGIISLIISIIVSVYMISDHKNLSYHCKRLMYAFLPIRTADLIRDVARESGRIFIGFISGKALDSIIIGFICFFLMTIFRFPYAVLISVLVGITNMIPYFGPYFGGAIGFLFVLIKNPIKALFFILLILVVQQFDGLFLGPKILGDSTGLKPLWVIFSITVGGSLFGVWGMFLGVPTVAVLSYILNLVVDHFLKKRNVSVTPYDSPNRM